MINIVSDPAPSGPFTNNPYAIEIHVTIVVNKRRIANAIAQEPIENSGRNPSSREITNIISKDTIDRITDSTACPVKNEELAIGIERKRSTIPYFTSVLIPIAEDVLHCPIHNINTPGTI